MNFNKFTILCLNNLLRYKVFFISITYLIYVLNVSELAVIFKQTSPNLLLSGLYENWIKTVLTKNKTKVAIIKTNLALSFIWTSKEKKINADKLALTPSILEMADKIFESGKYEECYNFLTQYKELDNIEVKWRLCRAMYNMVKEDKYDKEYKKTVIDKAHDIIESELKNHWDNYNVQKWYALTLDAKSSYEGRKQKLEQLNTVKKHMNLAVKLNPNDASLLHMLGEMCYQVTEMPWHQRVTIELLYSKLPNYSYEDALEYFLKAETVQPRFYSVNLLRLGCCYLKINRQDQAKYYLKLAASYPAKSNNDHQAKREAAEILKRLK